MRILLDTNVILDLLLNREPWVAEAAQIWRMCTDGHLGGYVCASSITDIFYIARRLTDVTRARAAVRLSLATFMICPVDRDVLEMAGGMTGNDFEDNLQIACAIVSSLDVIVTRDLEGFQQSPIRVLSPDNFLQQFPPDTNGHDYISN
jgi:predicted nucleic acid-binding protein